MSYIIDFVLHFDKHLPELVAAYGPWAYGVLFAIIFAETGLVVTVPSFINTGDAIRVNTETGEYLSRV